MLLNCWPGATTPVMLEMVFLPNSIVNMSMRMPLHAPSLPVSCSWLLVQPSWFLVAGNKF